MSEYVVTSQKQSQREQPTVPVLNVPNTIEWEPLNGSLHGDLAEVFTPDALSDTSQPEIVLSHLKKNPSFCLARMLPLLLSVHKHQNTPKKLRMPLNAT